MINKLMPKQKLPKGSSLKYKKQLKQYKDKLKITLYHLLNIGLHMIATIGTKIIETLEHIKIDPMITDKTKVDKVTIDTINNSNITNTALSGTHMI